MNQPPQSRWPSANFSSGLGSNPWASGGTRSSASFGNLTPPAPASRGDWSSSSSIGSNPFVQQQQLQPQPSAGFGSNPWNGSPSVKFGDDSFGQSQKSVWGAQNATSSISSMSMPSMGFGNGAFSVSKPSQVISGIGFGGGGGFGGFGSAPSPSPSPSQLQQQGFGGGGGFASLQRQPQPQPQPKFGVATGPSPSLFAPSQPSPGFGAPPQQSSPSFGRQSSPGFGVQVQQPSPGESGEVQHLKIQAQKHERQMNEANERIQILEQQNFRLNEMVQQLRGNIVRNNRDSQNNDYGDQVVEQRVDNPDYYLDSDAPPRPKHFF